MTAAQNKLYWREWQAVRQAAPGSSTDMHRHALHIQALGRDMSMRDFTNADFDAVLGAFRAISRPADLDAQLRQIDQPRTRALHSIKRHPRLYAEDVCLDKFGTRDIEFLTAEQLQQLAMTLENRRRSKARKSTKSIPF
jgi:hypothetical protein